MRSKISRRGFMTTTAMAASSLRVLGANDRIRLGVIGSGNRGRKLMTSANGVGNIEWVAVCDAWDIRRAQAAEVAGKQVQSYPDYRKLLDRKDIDGVIVATFDHLHSPITIDACQAGKDVYCEKPMTSVPEQGPDMVRAVKKTKRIVQVGMQRRSTAHFREAKERIFDTGLIGQVNMVRTMWNGTLAYITPVPPGMEKKPAGLDWNACLGWLPKIPWDPKRYFNRFAYWDFGTGGQVGGQFVHLLDVVQWFLDIHKPSAAVCSGGIYRFNDGRDTPDNVNLILEYPEKVNVTFEASLTDQIPYDPVDPILFMGSGGRFIISRRGYIFLPSEERRHLQKIEVGGSFELDHQAHVANWLECMRSRKQPHADVVVGHYAAMGCHIANLAYQEKTRVLWRNEWAV